MRHKIIYSLIILIPAVLILMAFTSVHLLNKIEDFIYNIALYILQHRRF